MSFKRIFTNANINTNVHAAAVSKGIVNGME